MAGSTIPTTPEAQRIAILYRRKLTTPWTEKEVRQFKILKKAGCFNNLDDLRLIECFYVFERGKGKDGIHRRDLPTFLNNWNGELDKARAWQEEQVERQKRKHGAKMAEKREEQPISDADFKKAGELAKQAVAQLRKQLFKQEEMAV